MCSGLPRNYVLWYYYYHYHHCLRQLVLCDIHTQFCTVWRETLVGQILYKIMFGEIKFNPTRSVLRDGLSNILLVMHVEQKCIIIQVYDSYNITRSMNVIQAQCSELRTYVTIANYSYSQYLMSESCTMQIFLASYVHSSIQLWDQSKK